MHTKITMRDFLGGPGVTNLPSNAGKVGSILGRGTKIPHATGQLTHALQLESPPCGNYWACVPRLETVRHNEDPARRG